MELIEAIKTRRSVRKYKSEQIPDETIKELIDVATWAPSGMNRQPWLFAVVQDKELVLRISAEAKARVLERTKEMPVFRRYTGWMSDKDFDIFYGAPTLVLIYGDPAAPTFRYDCSMAALNLMLAAWDRGIGSCWIGFAQFAGNAPEIKEELNVPPEYELVAPVILGYPEAVPAKVERKEPRIACWKR